MPFKKTVRLILNPIALSNYFEILILHERPSASEIVENKELGRKKDTKGVQ
jgi:hypothetical protein